MLQNSKIAFLFINLGSPEKLNFISVQKYLREFLLDPRVIDLPLVLRTIIVYLFVLPFRPKKTLEKYKKIWNYKENQSPIIFLTEQMVYALKNRFPNIFIDYAMRYGKPSIKEKLEFIHKKGFRYVHIIPLYPQYATSTYGSVLAEIYRLNQIFWDPLIISFEPPFYGDKEFIELWSKKIQKIENYKDYFFLFTFHGVPERHIHKSDLFKNCLIDNCCITPKEYCYKSQTFYLSKAISENLKIQNWSIAYQSRFGKSKWIEPYLENKILEIIKKFKKILIIPLSFVSDCLETLEELGITFKENIKKNFPDVELKVISSLNLDEEWIQYWEKKILKITTRFSEKN